MTDLDKKKLKPIKRGNYTIYPARTIEELRENIIELRKAQHKK